MEHNKHIQTSALPTDNSLQSHRFQPPRRRLPGVLAVAVLGGGLAFAAWQSFYGHPHADTAVAVALADVPAQQTPAVGVPAVQPPAPEAALPAVAPGAPQLTPQARELPRTTRADAVQPSARVRAPVAVTRSEFETPPAPTLTPPPSAVPTPPLNSTPLQPVRETPPQSEAAPLPQPVAPIAPAAAPATMTSTAPANAPQSSSPSLPSLPMSDPAPSSE